jgi:hypothetical protein
MINLMALLMSKYETGSNTARSHQPWAFWD